jgi:hypothetical protein
VILGDLVSPSSVSISFTPEGANTVCTALQTNNDRILEGNETFPFSILSQDEAITDIVPDTGEITILDNDSEFKMVKCLGLWGDGWVGVCVCVVMYCIVIMKL